MSMESMGLWGEYGGLLWKNISMLVCMGVCEGLWKSMDKYEYTSVYEYLWGL